MRVLATERLVAIVDESAVAAGVLQQVPAIVEDDARMTSGDVAHIVRQYPVVLGGASYAASRDSEYERALLAHSMALFTDDAQPERH